MALDVGKTARWMAVCAVAVGGYEGCWQTAKPDTLAYNIPTVCYGETEGVKVGDHYTKQQCLDMLAAKLPRYWAEIAACIKVPVSDNEKIAYTSFAYNVGSGGFCKSTVAKRLNAGDHVGACNGLMVWDRAGGREVQGLKNRRESERKICLTPDAVTLDATSNEPEKIADRAPTPVLMSPPVVPLEVTEKEKYCREWPSHPSCHTSAQESPPYWKCNGTPATNAAGCDKQSDALPVTPLKPKKTVVHKKHALTVTKPVVCTGFLWNRKCS